MEGGECSCRKGEGDDDGTVLTCVKQKAPYTQAKKRGEENEGTKQRYDLSLVFLRILRFNLPVLGWGSNGRKFGRARGQQRKPTTV